MTDEHEKLTPEQEARKTYLFFKARLTDSERHELEQLLGGHPAEIQDRSAPD